MPFRLLAAILPLTTILVTACTHPVDSIGEGDILSASGDRDCLLESRPCEFNIVGEYQETYTAVPRSGSVFIGWEGCESATEECSFDIPADVVRDFWGETAPTLLAKFSRSCDSAPPDTFTAIREEIFSAKGCTSSGCHQGGNAQAGMDLAGGNVYGNIVRAPAQTFNLRRVLPGNAEDSYLYRKVAAKTAPGSTVISGSPMPLGRPALNRDELAALALWIDLGAPETGRAGEMYEVEALLGLCDTTSGNGSY